MALLNPTMAPPDLRPSTRRSLHLRSPSQSPARRARDTDPLLRDLSPTTTLRAFSNIPTYLPTGKTNALGHSVQSASPAQRALCIQAARTCIELRAWTRELEAWEWPGTFEAPEPARKRQRMSAMSFGTVDSGRASLGMAEEEEGRWVSLPAHVVRAYEERVEEIGKALDEMDVEWMKDNVLSAHRVAGAGEAGVDDSIGAISAATDLHKLDDFTAIVTATILQALPYLSRLRRLLDDWTLRLSILTQAPGFLRDLERIQMDLDHGWAAIAVSPNRSNGTKTASFSRETMQQMRSTLEIQVSSLGCQLDRFLDDLEGCPETVPESWIEGVENLEQTYGVWVVKAERKVLEDEWRMSRGEVGASTVAAATERELAGHGADAPKPSISGVENAQIEAVSMASSSPQPANGISMTTHDERPTTRGLPAITTREISASRSADNGFAGQGHMLGDSAAIDSHKVLRKSRETTPSPTKYQQHVPIVIDYEAAKQNLQDLQSGSGANQHIDGKEDESSPPRMPSAVPPSASTKHRAAFLMAEIEKSGNLQRPSKTPVRPFEHASNAFSRLFSRTSVSPDQSRSNSTRSLSSSRVSTPNAGEAATGGLWSGKRPSSSRNGSTRKVVAGEHEQKRRSSSVKGRLASAVRHKKHEGVPTVARDYGDMPGGLPTRSPEDSSRLSRPRSRSIPSARHVSTLLPGMEDPALGTHSMRKDEAEYPADWPLASPPETQVSSPTRETADAVPPQSQGSANDAHAMQLGAQYADLSDLNGEIKTPSQPIETDVFDRIFVHSLPSTPNGRYYSNPREKALTRELMASTSNSKHSVSTVDELIPTDWGKDREMEAKQKRLDELKAMLPMLPKGYENRASSSAEVPTGDARNAGLPTSQSKRAETSGSVAYEEIPGKAQRPDIPARRGSKGGMSASAGPEGTPADFQSARQPDYFRLSTRPLTSAISSPSGAQRPNSASPVLPSPLALRITIPSPQQAEESATEDDAADREARPHLISRASVASIESHPRSQLKSISLPGRRSSVSSGGVRSQPQTPAREKMDPQPVSALTPSSSQSAFGLPNALVAESGDDEMRVANASSRSVSPEGSLRPFNGDRQRIMPLGAQFAAHTPSPVLSDETNKSAPLNAAMFKRQHGSTAVANGEPASPTKISEPLKPGEDSFDRHVSEVVETLPGAIRFKSKTGGDAAVVRTSEPRNYVGPIPKGNRVTSRPGMGGLTLAPAGPSPKKSTSTSEPEVKLYHLTQQGRDEPIKLFVRLVGEGERVMVRVGGGWADLADYLKQYAEHHGSRTVSSSGVEVQTADSSGASGADGKRIANSPAASSFKPSITPITTSPQAEHHFDMGDDGKPTEERASPLPRYEGTPTSATATPKSASTGRSSRPSTANSDGRPSSRQGWTTPGMAGLGAAGKRADLSEQQAKWVEGMIERTKQASAEKAREDREKYFGEMGKVGSTRRVVFKAGSAGGDAKQ